MKDIIVGLLAVAAGLMFCFRGYLLMRIVIPVWGFFVGFALGGAIISAITDRAFLGTVLGWIVGIVIGVVFAVIAYTYYAVAVVLTMGTVGYLLGSTLMVALDIRWNWLVIAVGVVVGFVLALGAILIDLPTVVLTVVTALSGATATIGGVMLIVNRLDLADLGDDAITSQINASWGWWLAYLVLALAGVFAQVQATENVRASVRSTWKTAATPPA
jgi:hypothetical protein